MVKKKDKNRTIVVPRRFFLKRIKDDSGVSGIGRVAAGVQFPSGKVVLEWLTETPSEAVYESLEDCVKIHGHNNHTVVEWIDNIELKLIM